VGMVPRRRSDAKEFEGQDGSSAQECGGYVDWIRISVMSITGISICMDLAVSSII
jgi:hypothetical protein